MMEVMMFDYGMVDPGYSEPAYNEVVEDSVYNEDCTQSLQGSNCMGYTSCYDGILVIMNLEGLFPYEYFNSL